jgi:tungstate transport system substrate-binding protein
MIRRVLFNLLAALVIAASSGVGAQDRAITVASTTSTEQSGLFNYLLPLPPIYAA